MGGGEIFDEQKYTLRVFKYILSIWPTVIFNKLSFPTRIISGGKLLFPYFRPCLPTKSLPNKINKLEFPMSMNSSHIVDEWSATTNNLFFNFTEKKKLSLIYNKHSKFYQLFWKLNRLLLLRMFLLKRNWS